jgi:DNA-binding HxlR family transcriptional regulator
MPTSRSYGDACGIGRALDVVGERWALLVVRELFLGPRRFSDLRRALPKASSNLLADRLRELEARGVIGRRRLAPPAGSWVYELTDWGRELEPIVLALGGWALRVPLPPEPVTLSATSVLLFLRGMARPDPAAPATMARFEIDGGVWSVRSASGRLDIACGEPAAWDVALRCDPATLNALIADRAAFGAHLADGRALVTGDTAALARLLESCQAGQAPAPAGSPAPDPAGSPARAAARG